MQENEKNPGTCYVTIGLLCRLKRSTSSRIERDEDCERVIVGCKVNVKTVGVVEVYINLEKHLMVCVANQVVREKFDLTGYQSCVPLIKYDGEAHKLTPIIATTQFDLQIPQNIEQMVK